LLELLRLQGKVRRFGVATGFPQTQEILRQVLAVAEVAQFASDAFNRNVCALPDGWKGLAVTHTPLRQALPRLTARLDADRGARAQFEARTGVSPDDRAGLANLLLADAAAANAEGMVLFSTSRPERIGEAVAAVARVDPSALAALHELAREARVGPTPDWGEIGRLSAVS
jgi:hypothetical protein